MKIHNVHCRIGSLENYFKGAAMKAQVHCRIGSLEMHVALP